LVQLEQRESEVQPDLQELLDQWDELVLLVPRDLLVLLVPLDRLVVQVLLVKLDKLVRPVFPGALARPAHGDWMERPVWQDKPEVREQLDLEDRLVPLERQESGVKPDQQDLQDRWVKLDPLVPQVRGVPRAVLVQRDPLVAMGLRGQPDKLVDLVPRALQEPLAGLV